MSAIDHLDQAVTGAARQVAGPIGPESADEVAALRVELAAAVAAIHQLTKGVNELIDFANRTDATLAAVRAKLGESIPKAIGLLQSFRA